MNSSFLGWWLTVFALTACSDSPPTDPGGNPGDTTTTPTFTYELVWADEFDGATIDESAWTAELMPNPPNNELQYYTTRTDGTAGANAWIEDGALVIEARREDYEHRQYTSARMITKGKQEFLYGRFEARIKQPGEVGMWPAFWLLGGNIDVVPWPRCGEIDIMEGKGRLPQWTSGAIHSGPDAAGHRYFSREYTLSSGSFHDEWHEFAIEWEPGFVKWYVDSTAYFQVTKTPGEDPAYWPFDEGHTFYIILNLAVGGFFDGEREPPPGMTPQRLYVDYVRVYQLQED
jgi:beta-glucanase (GH16 family)